MPHWTFNDLSCYILSLSYKRNYRQGQHIMDPVLIEIHRREKQKDDVLTEGWLDVTFCCDSAPAIKLNNIPYYLDKNKNVHIGFYGVLRESPNEDGTTTKSETPNFEILFSAEAWWNQVLIDGEALILKDYEEALGRQKPSSKVVKLEQKKP